MVDDRISTCPVCPFQGLTPADLRCPACATDLTALRRVQELPLALLDDALRALGRGDAAAALDAARAAAAFADTRPAALLVTGDARARRAEFAAAAAAWRAAARAGLSTEAEERLRALAALPWHRRRRPALRPIRPRARTGSRPA